MKPYVFISYQGCKNSWPNSTNTQIVEAKLVAIDTNGLEAQIVIKGTKGAINSIDDTNYLGIDGNEQTTSFNAPSGVVNVNSVYPVGFDIEKIRKVEFWVEDHSGWKCVNPNVGLADKIVTETGIGIITDKGEPLNFH